jgi:hypothetical protein
VGTGLTQAIPLTVHTSTQPDASPRALTTACDSTGSKPHSTNAKAVSHAVSRRWVRRANMGIKFSSAPQRPAPGTQAGFKRNTKKCMAGI